MSDVFLSYKREDQPVARQVAADLEAEGFSVFFDARIDVGDSWDEAIERELAAARATVVLWSPRSRDSKWVKREARESMARGILCPAIIRDCKVPLEFSDVQAVRLVGRTPGDPTHPEWRRLITAVERCVKRKSTFLGGQAVSPVTSATVARRSDGANSAPAVVLGLAILALAAGAWVWFADPFGLKHNAPQTAAANATPGPIDSVMPSAPAQSNPPDASAANATPVEPTPPAPSPALAPKAEATTALKTSAATSAPPATKPKPAPLAPTYIAGRWRPPGGDCGSPLVLGMKDNAILLFQTDAPTLTYRIRSASDYDIVAEAPDGKLVQFDVDPDGMTYSSRRYTRCP